MTSNFFYTCPNWFEKFRVDYPMSSLCRKFLGNPSRQMINRHFSVNGRATASKFGFKQHIGQIVVGKARFEAPFL